MATLPSANSGRTLGQKSTEMKPSSMASAPKATTCASPGWSTTNWAIASVGGFELRTPAARTQRMLSDVTQLQPEATTLATPVNV